MPPISATQEKRNTRRTGSTSEIDFYRFVDMLSFFDRSVWGCGKIRRLRSLPLLGGELKVHGRDWRQDLRFTRDGLRWKLGTPRSSKKGLMFPAAVDHPRKLNPWIRVRTTHLKKDCNALSRLLKLAQRDRSGQAIQRQTSDTATRTAGLNTKLFVLMLFFEI